MASRHLLVEQPGDEGRFEFRLPRVEREPCVGCRTAADICIEVGGNVRSREQGTAKTDNDARIRFLAVDDGAATESLRIQYPALDACHEEGDLLTAADETIGGLECRGDGLCHRCCGKGEQPGDAECLATCEAEAVRSLNDVSHRTGLDRDAG